MLLWHGSRLTNYVGILSHGLKIAPPEAPHRGEMFGKGIYFADMVTKSANYCNEQLLTNTSGLMLLCQVALGNMAQVKHAKKFAVLPYNTHSVKGVGYMFPHPSLSHTRKDGVVIPLGTPMVQRLKTSLWYNEYIVYDESQVKIEYLLKVYFKAR